MDLPELGITEANTETTSTGGTEKADERSLTPTERYRKSEKGLASGARYAREWRARNPERLKANQESWRDRNRERLRAAYRKNYAANREKRLAQSKASRERNPDKVKQRSKDDYAKNKEKRQAYIRAWRLRNPNYAAEHAKKYLPRRLAINRQRRLADPKQRLIDACRTRTLFLLKRAGVSKFNHTFDLIGCTPDFLKSYIEAKFEPWMNWDNFGVEWELDHIRPISRYDITDEAQKLEAFNYKNCRPFRKSDNRSKCDLSHEEWVAKKASLAA